MELGLKREHWLIMRTHVQALAPLEACGLLAGKNNSVENVLLIANQARSRVRFRMDPKEQLQAFDWIASQELDPGYQLIVREAARARAASASASG